MKLSKNDSRHNNWREKILNFVGPERARTADPLLAKQVLYQLSYRPDSENGGPKRNCTSDPSVISTVLY